MFVGSAGAYNADPIEPMHFEGDKRKSSAGHVAVEKHLASSGVPYTVFQPQYIYGPHTAKDCEQWFIERAIRQRPTPIPAPGIQLTTLTHVEDVASMMAAVRALYCSCLSNFFSLRSALVCNEAVLSAAEPQVPGNSAAVGQHYNVVSDRCISFDGIAKVVASALGQEPNIVHYDPAKVCALHSGKVLNRRGVGLIFCACRWAWARARASPSGQGTSSPRPARPRPSWAGSRSTRSPRTCQSSWRPTGPADVQTRRWTSPWTTRSWQPCNSRTTGLTG